jgi:hypothetical protein
VSLDERKQNFMTLLWKRGDEVGPKIISSKKEKQPETKTTKKVAVMSQSDDDEKSETLQKK